MESKFKIGDKVKGVGKNSDLIGIVCDISHSDDWISYYGRSYCREHYKIAIKSLSTNNIISWFHEGCFVLSD